MGLEPDLNLRFPLKGFDVLSSCLFHMTPKEENEKKKSFVERTPLLLLNRVRRRSTVKECKIRATDTSRGGGKEKEEDSKV